MKTHSGLDSARIDSGYAAGERTTSKLYVHACEEEGDLVAHLLARRALRHGECRSDYFF
jgi:hypothetical protein